MMRALTSRCVRGEVERELKSEVEYTSESSCTKKREEAGFALIPKSRCDALTRDWEHIHLVLL